MADPKPERYPRVTPYLLYKDVGAALEWLSRVFGFTERLRHEDDGVINHAEMTIADDGVLMLGYPGPQYRSPSEVGQATALVHVLVDDVDAHFAAARAAGARILREPADQDYGDRRYDVEDLEGHMWSFAQPVRDVDPADWGAVTSG
jgi:PhnB protein